MHRYFMPAAMGAAFTALLGISSAVKADVKIEDVVVVIVCDKRTVEEHLALIETDPSYKLAHARLGEDLAQGKCIRTPSIKAPVLEQGRQVVLTDSDGDTMRITVVKIMPDGWTLSGQIVGKGS